MTSITMMITTTAAPITRPSRQPRASFFGYSVGLPHFGQREARSETSVPQSRHVVSATRLPGLVFLAGRLGSFRSGDLRLGHCNDLPGEVGQPLEWGAPVLRLFLGLAHRFLLPRRWRGFPDG